MERHFLVLIAYTDSTVCHSVLVIARTFTGVAMAPGMFFQSPTQFIWLASKLLKKFIGLI